MIDTDYMEARAESGLRITESLSALRSPISAFSLGPGFGRWEAFPRGDGTFGVRKVGLGVAILSGAFGTLGEAQTEAGELNGDFGNGRQDSQDGQDFFNPENHVNPVQKKEQA